MLQPYAVLVPVRDGARWLPEFLSTLSRFQPAPSRTYFYLNNCIDHSEGVLKTYCKAAPRVTIMKYDYQEPYFHPIEQRYQYVTHLCKVRNALLQAALEHSGDWNYALMHDLTKLSTPELPGKLLEVEKPIVAPMVMREGICAFWDLSNFRDVYGAPFSAAPPFFRGPMLAEVGSVGSVAMIDREIFNRATFAPSKDDFDGTFVPFCNKARAEGSSCWVRRDVVSTAPNPM